MVKGEIEGVFFHVGPMNQRYGDNKHISNRIHHLFPDKTFLGKETTHTHAPKNGELGGYIQFLTLRPIWFVLVFVSFVLLFCFVHFVLVFLPLKVFWFIQEANLGSVL